MLEIKNISFWFIVVVRSSVVVGFLGRRCSGREESGQRHDKGKESQQESVEAEEKLRTSRRKGVLTTLHGQVGRDSKSHYNA